MQLDERCIPHTVPEKLPRRMVRRRNETSASRTDQRPSPHDTNAQKSTSSWTLLQGWTLGTRHESHSPPRQPDWHPQTTRRRTEIHRHVPHARERTEQRFRIYEPLSMTVIITTDYTGLPSYTPPCWTMHPRPSMTLTILITLLFFTTLATPFPVCYSFIIGSHLFISLGDSLITFHTLPLVFTLCTSKLSRIYLPVSVLVVTFHLTKELCSESLWTQ